MDALDQAIRAYMPQYGTNAGHGHVWARPDGARMRCGGEGLCVECRSDFIELATARANVAADGGVKETAGFCPTCGAPNYGGPVERQRRGR